MHGNANSSTDCQCLVLSIFITLPVLIGLFFIHIVILICLSLMTSDVEHIHICLLTIFFCEVSFPLFWPCFNWVVFFLLLSCRAFDGPPWWLSGEESTCQAGDPGLIPGSGRSLGEGNGNPFQCSCLENPVDRGALEGCSQLGHKESDTT